MSLAIITAAVGVIDIVAFVATGDVLCLIWSFLMAFWLVTFQMSEAA